MSSNDKTHWLSALKQVQVQAQVYDMGIWNAAKRRNFSDAKIKSKGISQFCLVAQKVALKEVRKQQHEQPSLLQSTALIKRSILFIHL